MFNEESINLWLESNRLLVISVDDWKSYKAYNLAVANELKKVESEYAQLRSKHKKVQARLDKLLIRQRRPDDGYKVHETPIHRNWCGHMETVWNGETWEEQ